MFYIYILFSEAANKYYIGHTEDYKRRLIEHNNDRRTITFTHKYRPWILKSVFAIKGSRSDAINIETFIKKQKSKKFIEQLINQQSFNGRLEKLKKIKFQI
jgi:putative endonuclease